MKTSSLHISGWLLLFRFFFSGPQLVHVLHRTVGARLFSTVSAPRGATPAARPTLRKVNGRALHTRLATRYVDKFFVREQARENSPRKTDASSVESRFFWSPLVRMNVLAGAQHHKAGVDHEYLFYWSLIVCSKCVVEAGGPGRSGGCW